MNTPPPSLPGAINNNRALLHGVLERHALSADAAKARHAERNAEREAAGLTPAQKSEVRRHCRDLALPANVMLVDTFKQRRGDRPPS